MSEWCGEKAGRLVFNWPITTNSTLQSANQKLSGVTNSFEYRLQTAGKLRSRLVLFFLLFFYSSPGILNIFSNFS